LAGVGRESKVQNEISAREQDAERLEEAIKRKIDAIFDQEILDNRFVRSSSEEASGGRTPIESRELVAQLKNFHASLMEERHQLKALLDELDSQDTLQPVVQEGPRPELAEMVSTLKKVGGRVEPVLDRLLALTNQMLDDVSAR
jgi:hypothetical protein